MSTREDRADYRGRGEVERLLRVPTVLDILGDKRSTLYKRIAAGTFPPAIHSGSSTTASWRQREVSAIVAARIRGDSDNQLRALVAALVAARKEAA